MRDWLSQPAATIIQPTSRHLDVLLSLLEETGTGGNLVPGAHLAALAVEHNVAVASLDHGFARFRDVKVVIPGR